MEIKLCGVGGQGMGFAGRLLGEAAIEAGLHVAQTTAYGVESRGGSSTSDMVIDSQPILFPEVRNPDALLIMAEKGLEQNLRGVHSGTFIFYDPGTINRNLDCPGVKKSHLFLEMALKKFGNREAATIIGLGALVQTTSIVPFEALEGAVHRCLPERVHEQNLKALRMGRDLK